MRDKNSTSNLFKQVLLAKKIKSPSPLQYVRIGTVYYKIIVNPCFGTHLKKWNKSTILDDHGRLFLNDVPKFDELPVNFNMNLLW